MSTRLRKRLARTEGRTSSRQGWRADLKKQTVDWDRQIERLKAMLCEEGVDASAVEA